MNTKKIRGLVSLVFAIILLASCGGGGGSGNTVGGGGAPGGGQEAPVLSINQALPGELISVRHSSIQSNGIVDVVFQAEGTQLTATADSTTSIPVKGIASADGVVDVAAPAFFDNNGLPIKRDVRVLINGIPSASTLNIEGIPELTFSTDGAVLEAFLSVAIDRYTNALDNLDTIAGQLSGTVDITDAQAAIEAQLQDLEDQLFELEFFGTHTVIINGIATTLSEDQLQSLDHWLLLSLVNIEVGAAVASANTPVATQTTPTGPHLRGAFYRALAAIGQAPGVPQGTRDFVENGIRETLDDAKRAARKGSTYLFGFVSLLYAGAAVAGDTALGVAASAQSMAAAQFSAFTSTVNAYLADKNTDSFKSGDRDGFDLLQEMLSQSVRMGAAYLAAISNLAATSSVGLTLKDMLTEAEVNLCQILGSPSLLCSGGGGPVPPASAITILGYLNFDGTTNSLSGGPINSQDADIKLSGNSAFPTVTWSGGAIALLVTDAALNTPVYGIGSSATDPNSGDIIPFNPPVSYGNYGVANTSIAGGFPVPAPPLRAGQVYTFTVQRSDFRAAALTIQVN